MEKIIFTCIRELEKTEKEFDKAAITEVFDNLATRFDELNDNEISKQILKHLPETKEIFINEDYNAWQDEPFIVFVYKNNDRKMLRIKRRHKIVWSILKSYCK